MKKVTKLLSVFLIAGVVGTGAAAGIVGCSKPNDGGHTHTAGTTWETDATDHWHLCTANDGEKMDKAAHEDKNSDGKCDVCSYQMASQSYTIPADVTKLIIEGVTAGTVDLSETKTSHTIDKSAVKVYLATEAGAKKGEVPAANLVLELKDPSNATATSWENLKTHGAYKVSAKLKDCTVATGSPVTVDDLVASVTVTVNNPIKAGSLVAKTGGEAKFTQVQGADSISSTWTYEVTRANGEKEDVAAADVTVGTMDTNTVGEKTVSITLKGTEITGTVSYTITADNTKVAQSYVLTFNNWTKEQIDAIPASTDADPVEINEVYTVVAGKGAIAKENTEGDNLFYNSRLKFGGKSDAKELEKQRYIKVTAKAAGTLTIYAYSNTGTAPADGAAPTTCSARKVAVYGSRTPATGEAKSVYENPVGTAQDTYEKYISTHTFELPKDGTYYIVAEGGDICFAMVKLDMLVPADQGVVEVPAPAGNDVVAKLSVSTATEGYKQVIKKGAAFTVDSEYTVKAIIANDVTGVVKSNGAVTEGITYWLGDTQLTPGTTVMNTLGDNKITVKVGDLSAEYTVSVESAVDGITGATASLADTVKTEVEGDDGKVTVTKADILVAATGSAAATVTKEFTVTYGESDTELTAAGAQFGVGTHTLKVAITVKNADNTQTATFNAEVTLTVTKKVVGELTTLATYTVGVANSAITNSATDKVTVTNNGTTIEASNFKFTSNSNSIELAVSGLTAGQQLQVTLNCKSGSSSSTVTFTLTASGVATGTTTSDALATDYADVAAGTYNVASDGTATLTIVRGGATLKLASITVVVKGVAQA